MFNYIYIHILTSLQFPMNTAHLLPNVFQNLSRKLNSLFFNCLKRKKARFLIFRFCWNAWVSNRCWVLVKMKSSLASTLHDLLLWFASRLLKPWKSIALFSSIRCTANWIVFVFNSNLRCMLVYLFYKCYIEIIR